MVFAVLLGVNLFTIFPSAAGEFNTSEITLSGLMRQAYADGEGSTNCWDITRNGNQTKVAFEMVGDDEWEYYKTFTDVSYWNLGATC